MLTKTHLTELTYEINAALIEVHKVMGPGLLESVYQKCFEHELDRRDMYYQSELIIPIKYKDLEDDITFRCDFLVESHIIVELKSVSEILNIHKAQIINYLKLAQKPKGILVNFNVTVLMKEGMQTFVNSNFHDLPE